MDTIDELKEANKELLRTTALQLRAMETMQTEIAGLRTQAERHQKERSDLQASLNFSQSGQQRLEAEIEQIHQLLDEIPKISGRFFDPADKEDPYGKPRRTLAARLFSLVLMVRP